MSLCSHRCTQTNVNIKMKKDPKRTKSFFPYVWFLIYRGNRKKGNKAVEWITLMLLEVYMFQVSFFTNMVTEHQCLKMYQQRFIKVRVNNSIEYISPNLLGYPPRRTVLQGLSPLKCKAHCLLRLLQDCCICLPMQKEMPCPMRFSCANECIAWKILKLLLNIENI